MRKSLYLQYVLQRQGGTRMRLGYARVSTGDQSLDGQCQRLSTAGCDKLFEEKISGATRNRPQLEKLIEHLRKDDILVVTRLDRLARSTSDLLRIAERLTEKNAGLQSLDEPWADTTSPSGRMVLTVFAGIAEFERTLIISRTNDGRVAAKARGVAFGRPEENAPGPAAGGQGSRPRREVDQRRRPDLRRSPGDDLPRHRGIGALRRFSVPLSRTGRAGVTRLELRKTRDDLHNALFFRPAGLLLERGDFLLEHDLVFDRVGMMLPLNPQLGLGAGAVGLPSVTICLQNLDAR